MTTLMYKNPKLPDPDPKAMSATAAKAIRAFCISCSGDVAAEVRRCQVTRCPLWPWRMGKKPSTLARNKPDYLDPEAVRLAGIEQCIMETPKRRRAGAVAWFLKAGLISSEVAARFSRLALSRPDVDDGSDDTEDEDEA